MEDEKLKLMPPNRDASNVRIVDGVLMSRQVANRHLNGTYKQVQKMEANKPLAKNVAYTDPTTGKKVSRSTEWRRRTAIAKMEKAIERGEHETNRKIDAIEEEFADKSDADRLRATYKELVRRLSVESHSKFITEVIWEDQVSINRRTAQMANLKNLLAVTKGMMELVEKLESERITNNELAASERKERAGIINAAEELLKRDVKK